MKKCNSEFLERNGIIIEDVCSKVDCHIYSSMEVNPIISNYNFQTYETKEMISVADIVGYDTECRGVSTNIFQSMDSFFDDKGRGYHTRSLGMLQYDKDNIIKELKQSFINEPISLIETGEGTYTVFNNGLHRYTLLRILYLSEVAKANGNQRKLAEIAKKYTIPAMVTGIDLDKIYCKYLLKKVKSEDYNWRVVDIKTEYDSNYKKTGNAIIQYANGVKEVLDNETLLSLTKKRVTADKSYSKNYPELQKAYDKYPSFRMFIDEEFAEIIPMQKREENKKGIKTNA